MRSIMKTILKMSHAVSLAFHATALLASNPAKQLSNKYIASQLQVSEAHLAKVFQRLSKVGFVKSNRGPKGGFMLGKTSDKISLLDVFEAIDGPYISQYCILGTPICCENNCIFSDLLKSVERQVYDYLSETKLSDASNIFSLQ